MKYRHENIFFLRRKYLFYSVGCPLYSALIIVNIICCLILFSPCSRLCGFCTLHCQECIDLISVSDTQQGSNSGSVSQILRRSISPAPADLGQELDAGMWRQEAGLSQDNALQPAQPTQYCRHTTNQRWIKIFGRKLNKFTFYFTEL